MTTAGRAEVIDATPQKQLSAVLEPSPRASGVNPRRETRFAWFESILNDPSNLVGLPNHSLLGFVRIATKRHTDFSPIKMSDALEQVELWIAQPNVFVPQPAQGHFGRVASFIRQANGGSKLVSDAHLAALAVEHGAAMCTHDSDFSRFAGLTVLDPLQPPPLQPLS
jgi:toxin-antitoxin system PIN domain toxin